MLSLVSRSATIVAALAVSLAVAAGPVLAQTQSSPPSSPPPSSTSPGSPSSPSQRPADRGPSMGTMEGSVKKVDPAAGTVQVSSGPFGILGRTLEVTDSTQIQVEGRKGTLADIREGATVKASYESRAGKNVATQIEVLPGDEKDRKSS